MRPLSFLMISTTLGYLTAPLGAVLSIQLGGPNSWSDFHWLWNGILALIPMLTGLFFLFSSRRAQVLGLTCLLILNLGGQTLAWMGSGILHGGEAGFLLFPVLVGVAGLFLGGVHLLYRIWTKRSKPGD
jgi:hypothetical protein